MRVDELKKELNRRKALGEHDRQSRMTEKAWDVLEKALDGRGRITFLRLQAAETTLNRWVGKPSQQIVLQQLPAVTFAIPGLVVSAAPKAITQGDVSDS